MHRRNSNGSLSPIARRRLMGAGLLALTGCAAGVTSQKRPPARQRVRSGAADGLLILKDDTQPAATVENSMRRELASEFELRSLTPQPGAGTDGTLKTAVEQHQPHCLVLIGRSALHEYLDLQRSYPDGSFPPAIALLTPFLERELEGSTNLTGINHAIPVVIGVSALRSLLTSPTDRIGVVHRQEFESIVQHQARLAAVERVQLVPAPVSSAASSVEIRAALEHLQTQKVDALWVLNDHQLVSPKTVEQAWEPVLQTRPLPTIVGEATWVRPESHFGTLAVIPALEPLGLQAAELVMAMADNNWRVHAQLAEPISASTIVDVRQAKQNFGFVESNLAYVERAVL